MSFLLSLNLAFMAESFRKEKVLKKNEDNLSTYVVTLSLCLEGGVWLVQKRNCCFSKTFGILYFAFVTYFYKSLS